MAKSKGGWRRVNGRNVFIGEGGKMLVGKEAIAASKSATENLKAKTKATRKLRKALEKKLKKKSSKTSSKKAATPKTSSPKKNDFGEGRRKAWRAKHKKLSDKAVGEIAKGTGEEAFQARGELKRRLRALKKQRKASKKR